MLALRFDVLDHVFCAPGAHVAAMAPSLTLSPPLKAIAAPALPCFPRRTPTWNAPDWHKQAPLSSSGCDDDDDDPAFEDVVCRSQHAGNSFDDLDDAFDLGPPPPSGPVLVRQRAVDWTATRERKDAAMRSQALDAVSSTATTAAAMRTARLIPSNAAASAAIAAGRSRRYLGV